MVFPSQFNEVFVFRSYHFLLSLWLHWNPPNSVLLNSTLRMNSSKPGYTLLLAITLVVAWSVSQETFMESRLIIASSSPAAYILQKLVCLEVWLLAKGELSWTARYFRIWAVRSHIQRRVQSNNSFLPYVCFYGEVSVSRPGVQRIS